MTHICVAKLTKIGSDNGLSPRRRQAIIWTSVGILLIGPLGTNFSEILIGIETFSLRKKHLKMSSAKWRSFFFRSQCVTMFYPIAAEFFWLPNDESFFKTCLHDPCTRSLGIWYIFVYGMCNGSYPWKDCGLNISCESDEVVEQLKLTVAQCRHMGS